MPEDDPSKAIGIANGTSITLTECDRIDEDAAGGVVIGHRIPGDVAEHSSLLSGLTGAHGQASLPEGISSEDVQLWQVARRIGVVQRTDELATVIKVADVLSDGVFTDQSIEVLASRMHKADWSNADTEHAFLWPLLALPPHLLHRCLQSYLRLLHAEAAPAGASPSETPPSVHRWHLLAAAVAQLPLPLHAHILDAYATSGTLTLPANHHLLSLLSLISIPSPGVQSLELLSPPVSGVSMHGGNSPALTASDAAVLAGALCAHSSIISLQMDDAQFCAASVRAFVACLRPRALPRLTSLRIGIEEDLEGFTALVDCLQRLPMLTYLAVRTFPGAPRDSDVPSLAISQTAAGTSALLSHLQVMEVVGTSPFDDSAVNEDDSDMHIDVLHPRAHLLPGGSSDDHLSDESEDAVEGSSEESDSASGDDEYMSTSDCGYDPPSGSDADSESSLDVPRSSTMTQAPVLLRLIAAPALTRLHFATCAGAFCHRSFWAAVTAFPALSEVTTTSEALDVSTGFAPREHLGSASALTSVTLRSMRHVPPLQMGSLAAKAAPNLRSLTIECLVRDYGFTDGEADSNDAYTREYAAMCDAVRKLPQLESLTLRCMGVMNGECLDMIHACNTSLAGTLGQLSMLTSLALGGACEARARVYCQGGAIVPGPFTVQDTIISQALTCLTRLKALDLGHGVKVQGLRSLLDALATLPGLSMLRLCMSVCVPLPLLLTRFSNLRALRVLQVGEGICPQDGTSMSTLRERLPGVDVQWTVPVYSLNAPLLQVRQETREWVHEYVPLAVACVVAMYADEPKRCVPIIS